ncbi:LytR/AlgR family response regulator transcription factor [Mucilaginibacter paludis]|uniref:Two component transcriptional regulator, LytTR family n=1 Tax=Mucilaginibacter paludis DSM 18603 TaxID=714943 RepID=H1YGT6_9SPHI|nr:LytTR family DNA-binding domain-containing protein [Mucilaginibacter paludis]EHQ26365.1 two component transcriptional regulator, LytTR family [Mucilaginibacter paludis DSM 18603]
MPNVLIIEDELPNIRRLEKMLHALDLDITIMASLQTVQASIQWLKTHEQPDIIFMDIRLTDGLSFEIFSQVKITASVIFTTAYDEYALRAFEVNGVDYLLKPLEADKLAKSISKAKSIAGVGSNESMLGVIKSVQAKHPIYRSRFLVAYRDKYILVMINDIAYFTSEHKATFLTTHTSQRYMIDQTLEMLEKELDPETFFRISRQFIVSLKSIHKIHQSFNGQLKVELSPAHDEAVMMSREKSSQFKKWLDQSDL